MLAYNTKQVVNTVENVQNLDVSSGASRKVLITMCTILGTGIILLGLGWYADSKKEDIGTDLQLHSHLKDDDIGIADIEAIRTLKSFRKKNIRSQVGNWYRCTDLQMEGVGYIFYCIDC